MNEVEGTFGPQEQPKTIQEWNDKAKNLQIVKKSQYQLIKYGIWILAGLVIILGYAVLNDSFKSEISCPAQSCNCPNISIPQCSEIPDCICPSNNLSCGSLSCNFPQNLSIKLVNSTG